MGGGGGWGVGVKAPSPSPCALPSLSLWKFEVHLVFEEEDAAQEAVEVGRENRQVDDSGAAHLHGNRHNAVQQEQADAEADQV